ncbi:MAG: succinate dehydrogenase cytochrome b subunit [Actinomycetota bacterium]
MTETDLRDARVSGEFFATTGLTPPSERADRREHRTFIGRFLSLYRSSVGRKFVMAISGVAIVGFLVAHLIGTLKIFLGPESTNLYGEALRDLGGDLVPQTHLLWLFRFGLAAAFAVHLHAAFSLERRNRSARPARVVEPRRYTAASYASRTMLWSGIIVGLFVIFHLADLTWGVVHDDFVAGDPYNNQIASFRTPWISAIYLLGVAAMTVHLHHGLWSLVRSLGARVRLPERTTRKIAAWAAIAIGLGYASIPIAVMLGLLDHAAVS